MIAANYKVTGILQQCVNGQWSERAVNTKVFALDAAHAKTQVLDDAIYGAMQIDACALVRWNMPELVSVYSLI